MNTQGLKQKQQNKLTPQQLMMAKLLQVPVSELAQTIQQEVEKNIMLEEDETSNMGDITSDSTVDILDPQDTQDFDDYDEGPAPQSDEDSHSSMFASDDSLMDQLINQLSLLDISEREKTIAQELIGSLDSNGYLGRNIELVANDLCIRQNIEVRPGELEHVLSLVQTLDPAGIGARNLQECLSIQLHRIEHPDLDTLLATQIIDNNFEDFSQHHYDKLLARLDIDEPQLSKVIDQITRLNPRPGFDQSDNNQKGQYIIPEFIVTRTGDHLSYTINSNMAPRVHISSYYSKTLDEMERIANPSRSDKESIAFLKEKLESAKEFIEAINQRHRTLRVTMDAILKRQKDYFLTGDPAMLKPLMQKEIAETTGLDDSTISRVVNQKYVQTEFGTFLLKEIFSKAISNNDGHLLSTEAIKHHLAQIIDQEDKSAPLTDDDLAEILQKDGLPVARRTVAKYRQQLGIPVGRMRKDITK